MRIAGLAFLFLVLAFGQWGLDRAEYPGGWTCRMDRLGTTSFRQCSSVKAGLIITRTSGSRELAPDIVIPPATVLAPLHPGTQGVSLQGDGMSSMSFRVDTGPVQRYERRTETMGDEIDLGSKLAANLKRGLRATIQVSSNNGRGSFKYTADLTGFTKAYAYIQRPFR